jgi:hypothetical protein
MSGDGVRRERRGRNKDPKIMEMKFMSFLHSERNEVKEKYFSFIPCSSLQQVLVPNKRSRSLFSLFTPESGIH